PHTYTLSLHDALPIYAIFLATTPAEELKGQLEVALIAGQHIFGDNGGRFAGAIICLGLVAAVSSMTWIGPRVTMSMGEDHWLLRSEEHTSELQSRSDL